MINDIEWYDWRLYADEKPTVEALYQWRVQHARMPDMHVRFVAPMRYRGAGFETVLSPPFDYWDGYRVLVPLSTQWRVWPGKRDKEYPRYTNILVEGLTHHACPFCGQVPSLVGSNNGTAGPHEYSSWWLQCCGWVKEVHFSDPRALAAQRNALLDSLYKDLK